MNVRKGYQLNIETVKTLEDVRVILDKLNLTTYPEGDDWEVLKDYFTTEIEIPVLLTEDELKQELEARAYSEGDNG